MQIPIPQLRRLGVFFSFKSDVWFKSLYYYIYYIIYYILQSILYITSHIRFNIDVYTEQQQKMNAYEITFWSDVT